MTDGPGRAGEQPPPGGSSEAAEGPLPPGWSPAAGEGSPLPPGGSPEAPERLTAFQHAVVAVVRHLEVGEVVTYAEVALEAGRPGSAQAVANVLRRVPGLPWWRVIPSTGRVYRTHAPVQVRLLRAEGIEVDDDRLVHPPATAPPRLRSPVPGSTPADR